MTAAPNRIAPSAVAHYTLWLDIPDLLFDIQRRLIELRQLMTSAQGDINAADAFLTQLAADEQTQTGVLNSLITTIQQLVAAGQPVSTAQLDALVSQAQQAQTGLDTAVSGVQAATQPPAAPPVPGSAPTA